MAGTSELPRGRNGAIPASIEIQPKQALDAALEDLIPAGTRVYLADVGTESVERFTQAVRRVRDAGLEPVPHIPCRRMTSYEDLATRISRFAQEGGATDALIIGGGLDKPAGPFDSAMAVLETGLLDKHGVRSVGIAGHPEGSPDFPPAVATQALLTKQDFAQRTDADMRIVTQFAFDTDGMITWAEGLAAQGIGLPVHIGVAGPAKLPTLIKYAISCGVGASIAFLKKKSGLLGALTRAPSPDDVAAPIEAHYRSHPDSPIVQLHVFPFGGLIKSSEWLVERGSWPSASIERRRHA